MKRAAALSISLAAFLLSFQAAAVGVAARQNRAHPVKSAIEFAANGVGEGELTFTWDFGDGTVSEPSSEGTATHSYDAPGHYPVIVVVTDSVSSRSASVIQTVYQPPLELAPLNSSTIVYDPGSERVCNVNADNDTVSCLSTANLELLFEMPVGKHPRSLALAPDQSLWVANQDDATVSIVSPDGDEISTIDLPRASMPFGVVINAAAGTAYVSLQATGEVVELSLATKQILRRVATGPWATGLGLEPNTGRLFVTRFVSSAEQGEVVEVDVETLKVVRQIALAMDPGPDTEASARGVPNYIRSAVPSPDGAILWVPSKKDNVVRGEALDGLPLTFETSVRTIVSMFDLGTNKELLNRRVDLNNRSLGLSLTFSPLGDYAFVGLMGNNGVEVLDAYTGKIVAGTFELGSAPDGLVLDSGGYLYVHSFLSRSIVVLDASPILASTDFAMPIVDEIVVSTQEQLSEEVLEGKRIFYNAADLRMGKDGYISCATCHLDGFEDGQVWDFTDRGEGLRNTTSLLGRRGTEQGRLHWSANFDEVQDFEHDMRGPFGGLGFLPDELFNEGSRNTTLGDTKAGESPELDALAAYVTSLDHVYPSPHRDPDGSLTEAGWRGLAIFKSAGCIDCHGGPDFTNSSQGVAYDVGTISATSGQRLGDVLEGIDTPTLRGIWRSPPYLHDGSAPDLMSVVSSRNPADQHGQTSTLDEAQLNDLVSYLLQIDNIALEDEIEPPPPDGDGGAPSLPGEEEPIDGSGGMSTTDPGEEVVEPTQRQRKGCSVAQLGSNPGPTQLPLIYLGVVIMAALRARRRGRPTLN